MKKFKTPSESSIEMREIVMPQHANPLNTIFGGVIMSWIDMAASMCASRHSNCPVVTVHVDDLSFKAPVKVGHHVHIQASVNYVGKTSMEVGVKVTSENPLTEEKQITTTAYVTMVAVDEKGRACKVIDLKPQSQEEKRRFTNAQKRVEQRKILLRKLKK